MTDRCSLAYNAGEALLLGDCMKATAIIPAYNEATRIESVLSALASVPLVDEIIVVDDGSQDNTAEVAASYDGALVARLSHNRGKGWAMHEGVRLAKNETVVFLDADLVGLTPKHVADLVAPVLSNQADMTVGQFLQGPPCVACWMRFMPAISGQRAMQVSHFLAVPRLATSGYGVEVAITRYARKRRLRTDYVPLPKLTHVIKEEKLGFLRGLSARGLMYLQMTRSMLTNGYQQLTQTTAERDQAGR